MKVRALLEQYQARPAKGLGQSFLHEEGLAERIVVAAELVPTDVVLEIGPGLGILTQRLVERAGQVIAIELDGQMVRILQDRLGQHGNLRLIQGDVLEIDLASVLSESPAALREGPPSCKLVANLPYYITSAVLRHVYAAAIRLERVVVMVQQEVAERIVAEPGEMSLLALGVQVHGQPQIVCRVSAAAFYPPPKVDSAVLCIEPWAAPRVPADELARLFRVARAGFAQKRKQLRNSLTHGLPLPQEEILAALTEAGIAPTRRPQTLSVEEWAALARLLPLPGQRDAGNP